MRRTLIIMATFAVVLQACVPGLPTGNAPAGGASAIAGEAVAVTTLDDPTQPAMVDAAEPATAVAAAAAAPATRPKPRPETGALQAEDAPAQATVVAPEAPKSREQQRCEKGGGRWAKISGIDARGCVTPTRDGGKSCRSESQCEGQCLARSKTCAPYDPLWGCNEVLQKDGSRVTLCLD